MNRPAREADVLRQVADYLRCLGLDFDRRNTGVGEFGGADGSTRRVRFGRVGDSDLTGTLPGGRRLDIEVKRPGRRPTPEQLARLHRTNAEGGVAFWTDSLDHVMRVMPHFLDGARVAETDGDRGPRVLCRPGCRACGGGMDHDRDLSAAVNIRDEGLRLLAAGHADKQNARGRGVRLATASDSG